MNRFTGEQRDVHKNICTTLTIFMGLKKTGETLNKKDTKEKEAIAA